MTPLLGCNWPGISTVIHPVCRTTSYRITHVNRPLHGISSPVSGQQGWVITLLRHGLFVPETPSI